MRTFIFFLFLIQFLPQAHCQEDKRPVKLEWNELSPLPPAPGQVVQPGLAGAFVGVHNDVLIIAGGANFPDGKPWDGFPKKYHDDIYVLEKTEAGQYSWITEGLVHLPRKVAYGISVPSSDGLICIGGMDDNALMDEVFVLHWDPALRQVTIRDIPSLPVGLANASGGKLGETLFVAGSRDDLERKYFFSLDLINPDKAWMDLPVWGGSPRTHAIGVVQSDGLTDRFYLFKGRFKGSAPTSTHLSDSWSYNPGLGQWEEISTESETDNFYSSAGTGMVLGANHIVLFGGDDGSLFNRLEQYGAAIEAETDSDLKQRWIDERDQVLENHPGFSNEVRVFHTITHIWSTIGSIPGTGQVTTAAVVWDDQIIIPSGEVSPGIRTTKINSLKLTASTHFGTVNTWVLGIYLLILIGIGIAFSKNQKSTEDFFKGGSRIPWWAAGLSIFGTQLSAITFMAIPAKTYATDWLYFFLMMTIIMVAPFIIRFFLPFYRRFNLTTAYEYLELRFNLTTRLLGSVMYIFLQLGRLGIVLLLPSLALSIVTGIDVNTCILTMGVLSILYTVLGGIEAVIWTDVLQVVVLLGGALVSIFVLYSGLGSTEISTHVAAFDKMRIFDFTFSFSDPTLWVVLIGGLASNVVQYGSDQTVVQRYLTTKDEKSAARSIMTGAWLTLPATLIFFSLGTLLFVYYRSHPELLNPVLENTDAIFPWYITHGLPDGISGLLIAAVFAASMSSLDSSMNSVSTVLTTDYVRRLRPLKNESAYLPLARWTTVVIGILGTGIALLMANMGISSLWDQFNMIVGLFAGGLGGIFVLGIFSQKANGKGAVIGLLLSGLIQYLVVEYTDIHLLMYACTGMVSSIVLGRLASAFFNTPPEDNSRFTYINLNN